MALVSAVVLGHPLRREVDGRTDDLLTAGLGIAGLRAPAPGFADPAAPTAAERRRRAIHQSYRALVDVSAAGGFGRVYGPDGDARVAGVEYLASLAAADGAGRGSVCLQIPAHFDRRRPLLLAVAASGSRGVYGALPTVGEWGLRRGAAVVHTDKGAGNGIWDVDRGRGTRIDGSWSSDAADPLLMLPPGSPATLATLPRHTLLFRHAHSGLNIEAQWGTDLLRAIDWALDLLGEHFDARGRFTTDSTRILAAGVSNGGAAVLRALEADGGGVIAGAVVSEPNAVVGRAAQGLKLAGASGAGGRYAFGLYDYSNLHYLLQPAAVLAETDADAPFAAQTASARAALESWCRALQARGVLPAGSLESAAEAARQRLREAGMLDSGLALGHFNVATGLWPSIVSTYAAAYARLAPGEQPYGLGFAAVDAAGLPRALTEAEAALAWADGSGIPPTAGISLVATDGQGARRAQPYGSVDLAVALAPDPLLGSAAGSRPAAERALLERIVAGHEAVRMGRPVGRRPVVMLHGRADGLIPVNHSSRPYYALQVAAGGAADLRYYEVVHGQHFDACLSLPEFARRHVPLQPWIGAALDRVLARLEGGAVLPPSQVLRSRPRSSVAEALGWEHLGALRDDPGADAIVGDAGYLRVPD